MCIIRHLSKKFANQSLLCFNIRSDTVRSVKALHDCKWLLFSLDGNALTKQFPANDTPGVNKNKLFTCHSRPPSVFTRIPTFRPHIVQRQSALIATAAVKFQQMER